MDPQKRLSLPRNLLWGVAGGVVDSGAKWAMFVTLARMAAPRAVGSFFLALAVVTPVSVLAQLQLRLALITDARGSAPFAVYHALRLATMAGSMVVIGAVAVAVYGFGSTALLIVLVGLAQSMISLRDIWWGVAQKRERMDVVSQGNMLDGVLCLALFTAAFMVTGSVVAAVCGLIVARLITFFVHDRRRIRALAGEAMAPAWRLAAMGRLARSALPLGLTTGLIALSTQIPRYFIELEVGRDELGYYAAVAYLVLAAEFVVQSLSQVAGPRLAALYGADRRGYGVLLGKLAVIAALLGAAGLVLAAVLGEWVLGVVYTADYARHSPLLVILAGSSGLMFLNSALGIGVSASRFFKLHTLMYVVITMTTLIACVVLVPRWGLTGAAWATVIASATAVMGNGALLVHVYRK